MPKAKTTKSVKADKTSTSVKPASRKGMSVMTWFFIIAFLSLIAWTVYSTFKYKDLKTEFETLTGGQYMSEGDIEVLMDKIKTHMILPEDIQPIITFVDDVEKLAAVQPFFENAQNGDIVLVYPEQAILYGIERDIIVKTAPVYIDGSEPVSMINNVLEEVDPLMHKEEVIDEEEATEIEEEKVVEEKIEEESEVNEIKETPVDPLLE